MMSTRSVLIHSMVAVVTIAFSSFACGQTGTGDNNVGNTNEPPITATETIALVDDYFSRSSHRLVYSAGFDAFDKSAIRIASDVSLFIDFQHPDMPLGITVYDDSRSITLHPNTFIGGAVLSADLAASDPLLIEASQVSQVIANPQDYRELCAFDHRLGGTTIAGTIMATTSSGETLTLGAEVGTSMGGFEEMADATEAGGPVISWPNKFCRGVKKAMDSCRPFACGMTLGDLIEFSDEVGVDLPTSVIAGGVDAITEYLFDLGYVVNGNCGEVKLIFPPIPLGCQCIYVQF